jgi:hypothetical protein
MFIEEWKPHLPKQLHNHNSHVKNEITLRAKCT